MKAKVVLVAGESGNSVYLREGPGKNYNYIKGITVGTIVDIEDDRGAWSKITADGRTGWMMSNHLEYIGEGVSSDVDHTDDISKIDKALSAIEAALITISEQVEAIGMINGRG